MKPLSLSLVPNDRLAFARTAAAGYAKNDRAAKTRVTYEWAIRDYAKWLRSNGLPSPEVPFPPDLVAAWIADLATQGLCVASIKVMLAAVARIHAEANQESPTRAEIVRATWRGIRRAKGIAQVTKRPISAEEIIRMVGMVASGNHRMGRHYHRDRAILLFGWASGLRRDELCTLAVNDLTFSERGCVIHLRRSKTDQEGEGRDIPIPRGADPSVCPVALIEAWLLHRTGAGSLFQCCGATYGNTLKLYASKIGIDPRTIGGHSSRRGLATEAAKQGKSERAIARLTGHRDLKTLRRYIDAGNIFTDCANSGLLKKE